MVKWIVMVNPMEANLAAFYRQKHPDLGIGAIASSPALRAVVEWPEYDKRAAESAGRECVKKISRKCYCAFRCGNVRSNVA